MTEFHSLSAPPASIPDNLTIPQFFLDKIDFPVRPSPKKDSPWLIEEHTGRKIFYEELRRRTSNLANGLFLKWNLDEDDVVCIFSPNHVDYPVAIWAIHRLGAIVTPANPSYSIDELVHCLEVSRAKAIVTHPYFHETATAAARKVGIPADRVVFFQAEKFVALIREEQTVESFFRYGSYSECSYKERILSAGEGRQKVAFLSFSSGTTGKPKAVVIPHTSVIANVLMKVSHLRINEPYVRPYGPGDVAIAVLPFFHIYGLVVNLHHLLFCGVSIVVVPKFDFKQFLESITRYRITHLFLVPPQIVLLCKHPLVKSYDLSHIKYILAGAAPLSAELIQQLTGLLPNASIGQGYGLTETCTTLTMFPPEQKIGTVGSAGMLISGVAARVVKADGTLAGEGEQGELIVNSPAIPIGYLNNPKATRETFVNGWVHTGDEVIIKGGEVFIVDRIKEIIKVRGFQVAPAELEGLILTHPAVGDVCVVGVPDEYSGELPLAYVVLSPAFARKVKGNFTEEERVKASITKHVSDHKIAYKHLKGGIEFIDVIPKNPSGKLLRRVLREKAKKRKANAVTTRL